MPKKEPLYPHVPKSQKTATRLPQNKLRFLPDSPEIEVERYHGIIVAVGGINTKDPNLPDWNLSYVEYPPSKKVEFRDALLKEHIKIVRVTDMRIYFVL